MSHKTPINQREYLNKYLGKDQSNKKRKKKKPVDLKNVKIIDDDVPDNALDLAEIDPLEASEYAPQIVAVVDERPPSMRIDEHTKDNLWKPIGAASEEFPTETLTVNKFRINKPAASNIINHYTQQGRSKKIGTNKVDVDNSPPRKRRDSLHDSSPPRRRKKSIDSSPPRKIKAGELLGLNQFQSKQQRYSSDNSPQRKVKTKEAHVKPDTEASKQITMSPDQSPPRRRRYSSDSSPPRKQTSDDKSMSRSSQIGALPDHSPVRRRRYSSDKSPVRKRKSNDVNDKMKKTLDGKRAGLQKASELVNELKQFKKREDEIFSNLSAEASGRNAKAVMRDRKTGKIRDLQEEAMLQQQKEEQDSKRKEKYSRWGRGLKQVEDSEKKIAETLHEMSKPLARYADDKDLETYLKEQEREGDPMLMYMKQKKRNKAKEQPNYTEKPEYMGEFMPNRYGIRPGHRWDGVDRSNGYEIKFFQVQNERKAQREESYKWSTEDM